jgi:tRNA threonylcarbamoyladenosine biosynthesis protein TsaE
MVIGLCGELGAGKTQLVKGLARGLRITTRVHSPTFSLVNVYLGGRLTLFHLDLYRLEGVDQIFAAGLEEYLRPQGVTVIEWAERARSLMNKATSAQSTLQSYRAAADDSVFTGLRWVEMEVSNPTERRISYEDTCA